MTTTYSKPIPKSTTRIYRIWRNILGRTLDPKNKDYCRYGAVGKTICDEWKNSVVFMRWAYENGYRDDLTIDRIDNNKGYSPDNCRFVDMKVQSNNRSNSIRVKYKDFEGSVQDLCKTFNLSPAIIYARLEKGMSIEEAVEKPVQSKKRSSK